MRDAVYARHGLYVELDGRPFHDTAGARDRDFQRDLDTAVAGAGDVLTVRLSYGQVCSRGCATVEKIARLPALARVAGALPAVPRVLTASTGCTW